MATIRKHGDRYHVQIRKKGQPPITKSFSDRKTAETFAKVTESRMERGVFQDSSVADQITLCELLEHYEEQILPGKKGGYKEQRRLVLLKQSRSRRVKASELEPTGMLWKISCSTLRGFKPG
jgi:ABC-type sugar transport system ATPase subunit